MSTTLVLSPLGYPSNFLLLVSFVNATSFITKKIKIKKNRDPDPKMTLSNGFCYGILSKAFRKSFSPPLTPTFFHPVRSTEDVL